MNTAVYLFGKLGGNYTQYPDDYTRNLFASYQKLSEQDMLAIRRKNAIIYYTYVYKIEEDYVGISLVFNGVFCTDVKALFAFFRKTINDLADKKDFLTRNNGQIVLKSLQVDILSKTCKELDDKLSSQIDNFAFQVLPPIHVGMDPSAWKIYSQDGITNDTISETLTNYNRIYIVGDKIVNTQPIQAADTQADNAYSPNEQHETKVEETQETEKSVVNNEDNQVASSSSDSTKRFAVLCIGALVLFVLVLVPIWLDTIQESYQDKVERHIEESSSGGNYSQPAPYLNVSKTSISAHANGLVETITVNCNTNWEVEYASGSMYSVTRNGNTLTVKILENTSTNSRTDYFNVYTTDESKKEQIKLTQTGKSSSTTYTPSWRNLLDSRITNVTKKYDNGWAIVSVYSDGRCGYGLYWWTNNSIYFGDFDKNALNGYGMYIVGDFINWEISNCPGGVVYVGNYNNDKKSGQGSVYDKNGKLIYYGKFANGIPTEKYPTQGSYSAYTFETINYTNGNKYVGELKNGKRHGQGMYIWAEGSDIVWYGYWKDGIRDGYGMLIYGDGSSFIKGNWKGDTKL